MKNCAKNSGKIETPCTIKWHDFFLLNLMGFFESYHQYTKSHVTKKKKRKTFPKFSPNISTLLIQLKRKKKLATNCDIKNSMKQIRRKVLANCELME
jgi:hypothetical protein